MNSAGSFIKLGFFTLIYAINPNLHSNENSQLSQNDVPAVSLTNVRLDSFSRQGNLELELEATSLKQDTSSGESYLTNPRLKLETPPGILWSIKSQVGTLSRRSLNREGISEQRIELSGKVTLSRRTAKGQKIEIHSDTFIFLPKKQYGETLSSVTLYSGNNVTTAGRLSVDLRRGEITLGSSSTEYVETKISEPTDW